MSFLGSLLFGTAGLYLLLRGKKVQSPKMMVVGGILIVLSYLVFS